DVSRIARQHRPPERTDSTAEQRPYIGRDEARVCERVLYTTFTRLTSQVVAIIENIRATPDVLEQGFDVANDRLACQPEVLVRIGRAQSGGLVHRVVARHVAVERVVGGRLVGD